MLSMLLCWKDQSSFLSKLMPTLFYALATSQKMSALLYAPAFAILLLQMEVKMSRWLLHALTFFSVHIGLALPFLITSPRHYVQGAFDFSRVFLYKWTVNWKMIDASTFTQSQFHLILLSCHLFTLLFFAQTRWLRYHGGIIPFIKQCLTSKGRQRDHLTADCNLPALTKTWCKSLILFTDILTTMWTCQLIGVLFARSLHYQFYAWYFPSIPYLLWQANALPLFIRYRTLSYVSLVCTNGDKKADLICMHRIQLAGFPSDLIQFYPTFGLSHNITPRDVACNTPALASKDGSEACQSHLIHLSLLFLCPQRVKVMY